MYAKRAAKFPNVPDRICKCIMCTSDRYAFNMNPAGPEKLCTTTWNAKDLLQLLGADTQENLAILERMSELSVASMDIESMTVDVHLEPPETEVFYHEIDSVALGEHIKKVQKPIMISHLDTFAYEKQRLFEKQKEAKKTKKTESDDDCVLLESSDDDDCVVLESSADDCIILEDSEEAQTDDVFDHVELLTLTARGDKDREIYRLLEKYWKLVLERCALARKAKRTLAQPLLEMANDYFRAHVGYVKLVPDEHGDVSKSMKQSLAAFKQSVPGRLITALSHLCDEYNIFTFYG